MVSLVTGFWFWFESDRVDEARFLTAVTGLVEQLDARSERYAEQLERLGDLVEGRQNPSEAEWNELVKKLEPRSNLPAFLELAYATNQTMPSRAAIEKMQRTESWLPFISDSDVPSLAVSCTWLYGTSLTPEDTSHWLQRRAVKACWWATANGRPSSSPRRLIPRTDDEPVASVSFFAPIFATDFLELNEFRPENSRELRHYRFKGIVIGTLSWRRFLETALPSSNDEVAFDAFADADSPAKISPENWMGDAIGGECRVLSSNFRPRFQTTRKWAFFRNQWQLVFHTTRQFEQHSTRYRAWVALAGGVLLSTLVAGALAVQLRARFRQEIVSRQLQSTLDELEAARRERERLSHDLHDGTIQALYALQLGLSRAADLAAESSPRLGARLVDYRQNLTAIIGELRGYILRHETDDIPQGNLASLLTALIERMRCSTETELLAEVSPDAAQLLSGEQSVHLANLAHEALSNALRHSRANRITVTLSHVAGHVALEIRDDGCGFDPSTPPRTGVGLQSMKTRTANAGGTFELESLAGIGTRVSVSIPVTDNPRSEQEA